eukprot:Mycagemm_TRINITY_DN10389_c0_g2::TRINITY_DN10389_c0_g2_i1::g.558::m.558 type:complete len:312 gc:universal TRINITY_DN10389_c0_g2_i1:203-1138(+)
MNRHSNISPLMSQANQERERNFDIEQDLMQGLERIHPTNNAKYRDWWQQMCQHRKDAAETVSQVTKIQQNRKAEVLKNSLLAMIRADEAMMDPSKFNQRLHASGPVIQLCRGGHLIRRNDPPYFAPPVALEKNFQGHYCPFGPEGDQNLSFGAPAFGSERVNLHYPGGMQQVREAGLLGFLYWYMKDPQAAMDKQRWNRRESYHSGIRGRKPTPLADSTATNHLSKLQTLLRWQFMRNNIDYYEVASLGDTLLDVTSWEKAFFYFAKNAQHNEAKTVIHYLEALEYLWMAVNSHQYCQTGLSFDQAQMVCL